MGPLQGVRVVELAGIGPAPFACMLLADLGADVVRIDRIQGGELSPRAAPADVLSRGRRSIAVDLKQAAGVQTVLDLVERSDVLVEGFRPGVTEKLGLGPGPCLERNPRLVYGRMTGWGQEGPLAQAAGHDLNYIALTGALHAIGTEDSGPVPPLNLVGDFGGGSMYLLLGVLAALLQARESGQGQVVDAAITDGVASLLASLYGFFATGMWRDQRQSNMLDGGAHYYGVYECSDGKWITIGSIEAQFYLVLAEILETDLGSVDLFPRLESKDWPQRREQLRALFKTRSREQWCELLEGTDVCFAPVLSLAEAPRHPHNRARGTFIERDGVVQPAPAPRFSRDHCEPGTSPPAPGAHTAELLRELGYNKQRIQSLKDEGVVAG